ncbi:DUF6545 domain-containing protein [Dactylosporangium sp. CA-139114]|uniref:DUF6545 domain-containing protein n=1 Tax=Dactylosporangium sp. CA-139114 TaxID=3239931 RepID=UPI003D979A90
MASRLDYLFRTIRNGTEECSHREVARIISEQGAKVDAMPLPRPLTIDGATRADFSEADAAAAKARAQAAGLSDPQVDAITEAARIAPALHSTAQRRAGHLRTAKVATADPAIDSDLDVEAEWLSRVCDALAHSPLVHPHGKPAHAGTNA